MSRQVEQVCIVAFIDDNPAVYHNILINVGKRISRIINLPRIVAKIRKSILHLLLDILLFKPRWTS